MTPKGYQTQYILGTILLKQQKLPASPGRKFHNFWQKNKEFERLFMQRIIPIEKIFRRKASHLNLTLHKLSRIPAHTYKLQDCLF